MKYLILSLFVLGLYSSVSASQIINGEQVEEVVIDGRKAIAKVYDGRIIEIIEYKDIIEPKATVPETNTNLQMIKFPDHVTALEVEDVYDIQVMAYQLRGDYVRRLVLEVPNQPESYPRLTSILRVLQDQGISHADIKINVNDLTGTTVDDMIIMSIQERPLIFAYQDGAPQGDIASR